MQTLFPHEGGPQKTSHIPGLEHSWLSIKEKMSELISPDEFAQWIEPLSASSVSGHEIVILLPNMMFYQTLLDQFLDKFELCKTILGMNVLIRFEIDKKALPKAHAAELSSLEKDDSESLEAPEQPEPNELMGPTSPTVSRALSPHSHLNKEYSFRTFVNGPSTQFAHASCLAVADNPGRTYNPLFLYGSTGLGKTHLLHAVGNHILTSNPSAVITYISSERFMNEMIYCLRFNKMWDFRKKYRNSDVILVDDIQFIAGKERTQEEFFHTFNSLYEVKKQIVVTSDVFPQDIPDIEDRLRNRFQWGLIADIQPPDVEHRVAILMNKAEKQGVPLLPEVAEYIAHQAKGSVRVLEGALRRVAAFATLQGRPIDTGLASEVLQNILGESPKRLTIEVIQKAVADHFKVKIADLKSKKRQRAYALPRQIAMFISRTKTNASFPEIGIKFGGKDHTTVMHAVRKIEKDKIKDLELKSNLESLERKIDQIC
ncbi:MAG: chromosomal replication initiator protein DnaA [Oligoflexales bacterium]